jgi:hypothetical protein
MVRCPTGENEICTSGSELSPARGWPGRVPLPLVGATRVLKTA